MNTNVKIALALGAFALAIFGVTVISSYTNTETRPADTGAGGDPDPGAADSAEPVRYTTTQIFYNPKSDNPALRDFPGYFEVNDQEHPALYWIQNPNRVPVEVSAVKRSCSSCTNVRMAIIPAEPRRPEAEEAASAVLGFAGAEAAPLADRARRLRDFPADRWKLLDFDHPEVLQTIPPAADDGTPTWVAVQVNFKVRTKGSKTISATLGFKTPNQQVPLTTDFIVGFIGMPRYAVSPASLDFHEMGEAVPSKSEEIFYWSSIVEAKDLFSPECSTGEPFLTFSKPEPITESERALLSGKLSAAEGPMRVRSGYRMTVTLHRKNPAPKPGQALELDIGPLEKSFTVFPSAGGGADADTPRIAVKATVTGLVSLSGGGSIDLGSFASREGTAKAFSLVSERLDLGLEVAGDLIEPKILKAELEPPKNEEGRRYWRLKVRIEGGATTGNLPSDSAVILRVKSTGQLVRLPAKGHALVR